MGCSCAASSFGDDPDLVPELLEPSDERSTNRIGAIFSDHNDAQRQQPLRRQVEPLTATCPSKSSERQRAIMSTNSSTSRPEGWHAKPRRSTPNGPVLGNLTSRNLALLDGDEGFAVHRNVVLPTLAHYTGR